MKIALLGAGFGPAAPPCTCSGPRSGQRPCLAGVWLCR